MLLKCYPDTTCNAGATPALPIPIDNKSIIDDINHPINELTLDYDIIQVICMLIPTLPIPVDIFYVKAHQDQEKHFNDLTPYAQLNILEDHYVDQLHQCNTSSIRLFPTWIPGTNVALFHSSSQITSDILNYIWQAAHKLPMHEYLIEWSQTATGCDS